VEFPAGALKAKKLKEIRLELAYIPSPYQEETANFTASSGCDGSHTMRTIAALVTLTVIGGAIPAGIHGLAHLPAALLVSGAAVLLLLAACILTRVSHAGRDRKERPDPLGPNAAAPEFALWRTAYAAGPLAPLDGLPRGWLPAGVGRAMARRPGLDRVSSLRSR